MKQIKLQNSQNKLRNKFLKSKCKNDWSLKQSFFLKIPR